MKGSINGLALCSGIGGIELGLAHVLSGYRTICYVEGEAYAGATLVARMAEKRMDAAPIWSDVRTFNGVPWRGLVDIVTAGYPCQPFSLAGKRGGESDPRHLWPHVARIVWECRPTFAFFENVPGHITLGLDKVTADLCTMGYGLSAGIFSAEQVGAPHMRKRLFVLATDFGAVRGRARDGGCEMVNAISQSKSALSEISCGANTQSSRANWWELEPDVGRVAHGVSARVDRLRALGNAVVPQVAAYAFSKLAVPRAW